MKRVSFEEIEYGMILGEDLFNDFGVMVLSSGTIIEEQTYKMLERLDFLDVGIVDKENEGSKEAVVVDHHVQVIYDDTVKSFKELFNSVKFGKQIVAEEIEDLLIPMLTEVKTNPTLAKKLWQIEKSDEYTYDHSVTVSMASALLGKWMHLSDHQINELGVAGLMHDIGKCNIPDEILKKPDRLTEEEFKVMKTHATLGYLLLKNGNRFSEEILLGVYQHHEKHDGNGYPNKLKGDSIHLYGKIIAVADVYSAMTSNRIYRKKMSPFLVARLMLDYSFGYLDPLAVNTFLSNVSNFYVGTIVKLTDGRIGEVVMINKMEPYRPLVRIDDDYVDLTKNHSLDIIAILD